jgi:hypothetical protein
MLNALPKTYIRLVYSYHTIDPKDKSIHADIYIKGRHIDCFEHYHFPEWYSSREQSSYLNSFYIKNKLCKIAKEQYGVTVDKVIVLHSVNNRPFEIW